MKNISSSKKCVIEGRNSSDKKKPSIKSVFTQIKKNYHVTNSTNTKKKVLRRFLQVIKACSRVLFFGRKEKEMDAIWRLSRSAYTSIYKNKYSVPCILKQQKYFEIQEKKIELQSNCVRLDKNSLLMSFKIYRS
jgi:hypothetical protein